MRKKTNTEYRDRLMKDLFKNRWIIHKNYNKRLSRKACDKFAQKYWGDLSKTQKFYYEVFMI